MSIETADNGIRYESSTRRIVSIPVRVEWSGGRIKVYDVTGTRHARNLLKVLAPKGLRSATVTEPVGDAAHSIRFDLDDIQGSDRLGKWRNFGVSRSSSNYDLDRKPRYLAA